MQSLIFSILLIFGCIASNPLQKATLLVKVQGFHSDKGSLMIALYNSSKTYMKEPQALCKKRVKIQNKQAMVAFKGLTYGDYAFVLFHDANSNLKLDKNLIGIPKEAYGFSNNARGTFGPPSFHSAKFSLQKAPYKTTVLVK